MQRQRSAQPAATRTSSYVFLPSQPSPLYQSQDFSTLTIQAELTRSAIPDHFMRILHLPCAFRLRTRPRPLHHPHDRHLLRLLRSLITNSDCGGASFNSDSGSCLLDRPGGSCNPDYVGIAFDVNDDSYIGCTVSNSVVVFIRIDRIGRDVKVN